MKHPPTKPALLVLRAIFAAAVLIGLVACGGGGSSGDANDLQTEGF